MRFLHKKEEEAHMSQWENVIYEKLFIVEIQDGARKTGPPSRRTTWA
jgi:hypothetical protein